MVFIFYFKKRGLGHPTMKEWQIAGVLAEEIGKMESGGEYGSHAFLQHACDQRQKRDLKQL